MDDKKFIDEQAKTKADELFDSFIMKNPIFTSGAIDLIRDKKSKLQEEKIFAFKFSIAGIQEQQMERAEAAVQMNMTYHILLKLKNEGSPSVKPVFRYDIKNLEILRDPNSFAYLMRGLFYYQLDFE